MYLICLRPAAYNIAVKSSVIPFWLIECIHLLWTLTLNIMDDFLY